MLGFSPSQNNIANYTGFKPRVIYLLPEIRALAQQIISYL
jgi:hypothetical protein